MIEIMQDNPNIIILGAWNTAILSPNWLKEQFPDIIDDKTVKIEAGFGINSNFVFHIDNIKIIPSANRLIFVAKSGEEPTYKKIKALATGIIELLPHTPIISVGHNIAYNIQDHNIKIFTDAILNNENNFYETNLDQELVARNIKHSIAAEKHLLNIEYKIEREIKIINLNFHYDINSFEMLIQSINSFEENVQYSNTIIKKLVS
ncbi:MAG: hypothetical protein GY754_40680 [bacterium]|nr:hypothetical protein [bacterium]